MKTRRTILAAALALVVAIPAPAAILSGGSGAGFSVGGVDDPPGYVWDLGDLDEHSERLETDWNLDSWADGYDTEAELNALGWTTIDVEEATSGITCTHGGAGNSEDEAGFQALFTDTDNCSQPSGDTPGVCNKVFKIASGCVIDVTSSTTDAINGAAAINIKYSNFAIIGEDETAEISANNTVSANTDMVGPLFSTGSSWGYTGGADLSTYTRGSGAITKGTASLTISGSCSGLVLDDLIRINGTNEDGEPLVYQTEITNTPAGSDCTLDLADPLPTTFTTITGVTEKTGLGPQNQIFLGFKVGFPYLPDGVGTNASDLSNALIFRDRSVRRKLIQNMHVGSYGQTWLDARANYQLVARHSTFGRGLHTLRRQNNSGAALHSGQSGSLFTVYNNIYLEGAIRFWPNDNAYNFAYIGFNYQVPQVPSHPSESGHYCGCITNPQGFPCVSSGPERSIFFAHDPASSGMSRMLFEANDFKCNVLRDGTYAEIHRYLTMYRNRHDGQLKLIQFINTGVDHYMNWFANRAGTFELGSDSDGTLGLFNVAESTIAAPSGTGVSWTTSAPGDNYVDTGPHDEYPADLPPSLRFRTNDPPEWWCQESGPWNGSWSFGYGDGGDNGGTPRKLPAQIRHEAGTCTPP